MPRIVDEELFSSLTQAIEYVSEDGPGGRVRIQSWRCISMEEKALAKKAEVELVPIGKDGDEIKSSALETSYGGAVFPAFGLSPPRTEGRGWARDKPEAGRGTLSIRAIRALPYPEEG